MATWSTAHPPGSKTRWISLIALLSERHVFEDVVANDRVEGLAHERQLAEVKAHCISRKGQISGNVAHGCTCC
jgi:hypothetical protein